MASSATELTIEHYLRPEVKEGILRYCQGEHGARALNADEHWYRGTDDINNTIALRGPADYEDTIKRGRTLYATLDILEQAIFEQDSKWDKKAGRPETPLGTLAECIAFTLSTDIDGIGDIRSLAVKEAVEAAAQFHVDYLKARGIEKSVYCLYSGGGIYVHLHHGLFAVDVGNTELTPEARKEQYQILCKAYNRIIGEISQAFFRKYPQYIGLVKFDQLNNQKRTFKTIFSIHKRLPYAVIPLDPKAIEIDFGKASLPLSSEVLQEGAQWYQSFDPSEKEAVMGLLKDKIEAVRAVTRDRPSGSTDGEISRPEEPLGLADFAPCMKNIIEKAEDREGRHRALAVLATYLYQMGWREDAAFDLWLEVADRCGVESRIFETTFGLVSCPLCSTMLQDTGGYPHLNLHGMGFCVPDEHCKGCQWPGDHHLQVILNENFIKPKGADQPKGPMILEEQSSLEHLTEGGNAHRLERIHGDDMRFNHTHKKWLVWDGGRWKVDGDGNASRLAEDVVGMLYNAAAKAKDSKMRDKIAVFAKSTDSRKGINNMLALAANRRKFALTADDFDKDPWLLGAGEVTIDLKACQAIEPRRSDLITMQAGAVYNSFADCPLWEKFLKDIFDGNEDIIKYIKRAVGYCLTGSTSEQIFFFCYGTGANGKSVFLAVLRALMGEYAKQADFSSFLIQRNEKVRNDLAGLAGARVITAVEAEEGGRLSMQVLKSWTGGDPITARFLFGENFTFKPQGKIWLAANTKPAITERNYAAWRRVHLIPFNVTIPPEKRDQNLENKLIAELPGILNWALEGLKDYLKVGLKTPEAVAKATAEYRKENDSLESFIAECCETGKLKVCKNSELYPNYVNFCNMSGLTPLSQTKFSPEMNSKPGISSKKSKFGVEWKGIDLRPEWRDLGDCTNPSPLSGGPKGDDLDQNAERSLKSSLREGLRAFESNPSPNQSTDSGDGLSQPVTKGKTEPSKRSVAGGQKEGDEGDSVNILKVGFRTDYRTDWNGKMHDFKEGEEIEVARWRAEAWQKRGIVDIVEAGA